MKLSILICSLIQRKEYLERLRQCLEPQIKDKPVEVLVALDSGERSIGTKRNQLLDAAKGQYICCLDDDDLVSNDYIEKILCALKTNPDCLSLHLLMYTDGQNPQHSYHSLKYKTWYDEPDPDKPGNKIYFRSPNHLNVVKRELALQVRFPEISMGEDRHYSANLLPLLKTEVEIPEPIYYYLVRTRKEC